jgi:hypothetical protein
VIFRIKCDPGGAFNRLSACLCHCVEPFWASEFQFVVGQFLLASHAFLAFIVRACRCAFSSYSYPTIIPLSSQSHLARISLSSHSHPTLISFSFSSHSHLILVSLSSHSHLALVALSSHSHVTLISLSSHSVLDFVSRSSHSNFNPISSWVITVSSGGGAGNNTHRCLQHIPNICFQLNQSPPAPFHLCIKYTSLHQPIRRGWMTICIYIYMLHQKTSDIVRNMW